MNRIKIRLKPIHYIILAIIFPIITINTLNYFRGKITAEVMNYYCSKEAKIEIAKNVKLAPISLNEYNKQCRTYLPLKPYCLSNTRNLEWIEIEGSAKRQGKEFPERSEYLKYRGKGGLFRVTENYYDMKGNLIYTIVDFYPNAYLTGTDLDAYYKYKEPNPKYRYHMECNFPEDLLNKTSLTNGILVSTNP